MTVYRYIRTGRLPAARRGGTWRVAVLDVEALSAAGTVAVQRGSGTARARSRLVMRLTAGDEAGAWDLVERGLSSGTGPEGVLVGLIGGSLEEIGAGWSKGELSVADEHRASAVAARLIGRLGARFQPRGRKRGTVVLAAAQGELHSLPVSMAANVLRWSGFAVQDLGADTPPEAVAETARLVPDLLAVAVASTSSHALASVPATVVAVRTSAPGVPVLLGGGAIADAPHAVALGADYYTGRVAADLLLAVNELVGTR
jgi:methanogenic corrinoid protein MtbC1